MVFAEVIFIGSRYTDPVPPFAIVTTQSTSIPFVNDGASSGAFNASSVSSSFIAACTVVADIVPAGVFATVVAVWSPVFVPLVFPITTFSAPVT